MRWDQIAEIIRSTTPDRLDTYLPMSAWLAGHPASTAATYRKALRALARALPGSPAPEAVAWHRLDVGQLNALRASQLGHAPSTVAVRLAALRGVLATAYRQGLVTRAHYDAGCHACRAVRGSRVQRGQVLEPEQRDRLLAVCAADPSPRGARDHVLLALLFGAGLRRAELVSLTPAHVSLADPVAVTVRGKGNAERLVPLPAWAATPLRAWLATPMEPLFRHLRIDGSWGSVLTPAGVRRILARRCVEAGLPVLRPHDARRTYASTLLLRGADLATVAGLLGHSRLDTTRRYDLRPQRAREEAVRLLE